MFVSNTTFIMHQPKKQKETFKTVADLWVKHGAKSCNLMSLRGSNIGEMAFVAIFDNHQQYGSCMDRLEEDEDYQKWQLDSDGYGTFTSHRLEKLVDRITA